MNSFETVSLDQLDDLAKTSLHIRRERFEFISDAIVEQLYYPGHPFTLLHFCNVAGRGFGDEATSKRFNGDMIFTPYVSHAKMNRMSKNVNDIVRTLSSAQRKKVEGRTAELIAEEMTLQELRRARKLTQVSVAKALGITQDSVSRLEKRSDILLSTLRKTVQVMGGNLLLVAEFPDRAPVVLSGIADATVAKPIRRKHARV
jgi:DNA-binding XRE family transcriptional regulator